MVVPKKCYFWTKCGVHKLLSPKLTFLLNYETKKFSFWCQKWNWDFDNQVLRLVTVTDTISVTHKVLLWIFNLKSFYQCLMMYYANWCQTSTVMMGPTKVLVKFWPIYNLISSSKVGKIYLIEKLAFKTLHQYKKSN